MIWEITKSADPVNGLEEIQYRVTRQCRLQGAEGIDRTSPCMITLSVAPTGAPRGSGGICLVQGAIAAAGFSASWSGDMELSVGETVLCLFNDVIASDVLGLSVKVVEP